MIIDFHTHIFSAKARSDRGLCLDDPQFRSIYESEKAKIIDHRDLLSAMKGSCIDFSVAMGFSWEREEFCASQNDYFRRVPDLSDGMIIPFGSVPINGSADAGAWVREIRDMGLRGVGEVSFYHTGVTSENLDFLRSLLDAVTTHSMPLCLHVNEPVGHRYPGKYDPALGEIFTAVAEYPDASVIFSHWGGGLLFYELMPEVRAALANCYYDTAASPFLYDDSIYKIAPLITGPQRILFGSDYPLIAHERYLEPIGRTGSEELQTAILGSNAARLLGITQDDGRK